MKSKLTDIEWITCIFAVRYAMGRQTIASATLPKELIDAYGERWTEQQKKLLLRDLEEHIENYKYFGDKRIDHPAWMGLVNYLKK